MKKGIFYSLMTAFISGISIFYNKNVLLNGLDPVVLNIVKNGGTAIILSLFLFSLPKNINLSSLSSSNWKKIILIGLIGGSLPFLLFFEGLKIVPAINAGLIQKTLFVWVALFALPFLKEKLNIWQIMGYLSVIGGNFLIGSPSPFSLGNGELLILLATLLWSIEIIISKKLLNSGVDNHLVSWGRMFFGTAFLLIFVLFQNKLNLLFTLRAEHILPLLGSIILLTVYVRTFYKALNYAPATLATSILVLSTPVTNLLNTLFISHVFPSLQLNNLFFSLIGVIIISIFLKENPQKSVNAS